MITKNDTVGVLMGGPSREADVSRHTGTAIAKALSSLGYHVVSLEYEPDRVLDQLEEAGVDVVFLALHGKYGEDGTIQGMLELKGIPYTGSGVASSAVTMDKILSCRVFREAGIPMAFSRPYYSEDGIEENAARIEEAFAFPFVLKPACEGSTIGIEVVHDKEELPAALRRVFQIENRILAEAFLEGKEYTVPVLNGRALSVIEICPHSGQYDYYSKYTKGATDYLVPAPIPERLKKTLQDMAVRGYRAAECCGVVRFDMKTDQYGEPFLLEANSIPGMTETSLVPKAAAAEGMSFPRLCEIILQGASTGKV